MTAPSLTAARISEMTIPLVVRAITSGLTFNEAIITFRVCARIMEYINEFPNCPDEELARLAEKWCAQEIATQQERQRIQ